MSSTAFEIFEDVGNPLDSVEDIFHSHDWVFTRPHPDEISVQVTGKIGTYRLTFMWQSEYHAMQFFCEYGFRLPKERCETASCVLRVVNERLWLGHFDVPAHNDTPCFRHTSLFRGWTHNSGADHIEDLVDIALAECERHHGVFELLAGDAPIDNDTLSLMIADEAGEA